MYTTIQGRKIWYTEAGTGLPVVLLHGYLESSEIWNGFSEKLSSEFRVISIDLPGQGKSDVYSETHSMEMIAEVIKELTGNLRLGKFFLVGHSLGGYVTMAFVDLYPGSLKGYCLFHSHPMADSEAALQKRKNEIAMVLSGKKDLIYPDNIEKMFASSNLDKLKDEVKRSKKIASGTPGNGIIAVLNGMMKRPSRIDVMEKGKVPCLWILGAKDNYIDHISVREKIRLPENAGVILLKQSGHMGFIEEQDASVKAVSDFIKEKS
ncbi:MAG TPA: alpha/beta hydrolase [Bacteroidales bacterium]|nr:alpha/beta hydrolase [Bacteroidales bacterium]